MQNENVYFENLKLPLLNHCLLLIQSDKQLVKNLEKLFELYIVDGIHSWKPAILKTSQCSILKLKTVHCNHQMSQRHFYLSFQCPKCSSAQVY